MEIIKANLEKLFNQNYDCVKSYTLDSVIKEYINNTNEYYLSLGITNYLEDQEVTELNEALRNKELRLAFENAINLNLNEDAIVYELISDIKNAIADLKTVADLKNITFKIQLIFIEHDQLLSACLNGYGEGDYPVLSNPKYFEYNYQKEVYSQNKIIDYTKLLPVFFSFNLMLEELELDNYILDSNFYECLSETYKYKVYLLLNKAFHQIGINAFDGIAIQKPFHVYANEHDCPVMNIYVFD